MLAAAVFLLALAACGGGGGGSASSDAQPAKATATVTVTVSGLPASAQGSVRVEGAGGYARSLGATGTLTDVPPGTVTVSANRILIGGTPWDAVVTPQVQSVAAGGTAGAAVNYVADLSTLVTLSGIARFDWVPGNAANGALDYAATQLRPIRGAVVEAFSAPANELLATTTTDADGRYSLQVRQSAVNVVVRVRAQYVKTGTPSWNFQVLDNTRGNAPYFFTAAQRPLTGTAITIDLTARSGWTGGNYGEERAAAPFAILDAVWRSHQKTLEAAPTQAWPPLDLMWSVNNRPEVGTEFHGQIGNTRYVPADASAGHRIYILGQADVDTDEYDAHVIVHEFGHYVEDVVSRDHTPAGEHTTRGLQDMRLAFSEGWSNAWSAMVLGDPFYRDSRGPGQQGAGSSAFDIATAPPVEQAGWYREDSVGSILWQLHQHPDVGFAPIWKTMTGPMRDEPAATGIHMFAAGFRKVATPTQISVLDAALVSQRIAVTDLLGTLETNDGKVPDVLPLYKPVSGLNTPVPLCVNNDANTSNSELGRFAYARILLAPAAPRDFTIALAGSSNGTIEVLGPNRLRLQATQSVTPFEATFRLNAGYHVIAVSDEGVSNNRRCMTLTVR